jgi:superfamily II DNA or RNA helicase
MVTSTGIEYMDSACASLARKYGWEGVSADIAWDNMLSKKVIWDGNLSHTYHPKKLYIRALNGMKALKKIRMFVQNHHSKIEATVALCDAIRAKTITFSETTEMADKITREINKAHPFPIAIAYHSKSRITVLGKLLSNKKSREYILESLKVGEFSIVNSAKALDEGADMPEMLFGIRVAGTSSPTQQTQRRGRLLRKHGTKEAIMVNLYLLGTKEMQWLSKSQGYDIDIHWVESIREILDDLGL